jgi:predicted nucleotidyltransferase
VEVAETAQAILERRKRERDTLLERATAVLKADERVVAAFLTGSLGRGDSDDLSDLDVWTVVRDDALPAVLEDRERLYREAGDPVLIMDVPHNAPPGGAYSLVVFAGCHQMDWYFGPQSGTCVPKGYRVLFDRVGLRCVDAYPPRDPKPPLPDEERARIASERLEYFWAMTPIIAKNAVRGRTDWGRAMERAVEQLRRLLDPPRSGTWEEYDDSLKKPPKHDPLADLGTLRILADEVEALMPQIKALGGEVSDRAPAEVRKFLDACEALVRGQEREDG